MESEKNLIYELPDYEYMEWKEAMNLADKEAIKVCENILRHKYPNETFAQASARMGVGDPHNRLTHNWYYNNKILYVEEV